MSDSKNLQQKFDAALDDDIEIDDIAIEEGTAPTQIDDLELGDELELDSEGLEELPDTPTEASSEEVDSGDLDLSLDDELSLDAGDSDATVGEDISSDSDLDLDLDETPPHAPTETKIKVDSDIELDLGAEVEDSDLDLGEDPPPQVPNSSSDDLEAELLDEASDDSFHLTEEIQGAALKNQNTRTTMPQKMADDVVEEKVSASELMDSLGANEPSLSSIKNEDSVKFFKGDESPVEKARKSAQDIESQMLHETVGAMDRIPVTAGGEDLVRLQTTLRHLRTEREKLLKDLNTLKTEKKLLEQDNLGLKAEIDELKIELSIVKKRNGDDVSELRYQLRVSEEKKSLLEEKVKAFQKEFERVNQKVRVDINQVKQREKELEGKLELMTMDSASQIQSRDNKILELKRKIDALEFNMENISIQEQKAKDDKQKTEERLMKIVKTLRGSIKLLEDDVDLNQDFLEEIKKM